LNKSLIYYRLCIAVPRKPSYLHKLGTKPLSPETTGQIVDKAAQEWGDRDALVSMHEGHRLSFRKVKEEVSRPIVVVCLLLF
jgi:hypothetical protein